MSDAFKKIPRKYHPRGFEILYEDLDLIIGNKAAGALTVAAKWNPDDTIHSALNTYVRKGNSKSRKSAFVVHRLDQATTGVLIFAKSEQAQQKLKNNWVNNIKIYYAIVHGVPLKKSGLITSYLEEDEDYVVHSNQSEQGKLAKTEYEVVRDNGKLSLVKVNLLTGRKNQIRVHMTDLGHPIVGDTKYGQATGPSQKLCLHSASIEFDHPHSGKRTKVEAPLPPHFRGVLP